MRSSFHLGLRYACFPWHCHENQVMAALISFEGMGLRDKNQSWVGDMCVNSPELYTSVLAVVEGLVLCASAALAKVVVKANSSPPWQYWPTLCLWCHFSSS